MSATLPMGQIGANTHLLRLLQHGELLRALLRRDLRARYKGAAFGLFWSYAHPLLMMGVYTLVFSVLWRVVEVPHYPLFVLSGLAVWIFFQSAVQFGAASLVANASVLKQVWFPRETIPVSVVLSQAASTGVMLAVLIPVNLIVVPEATSTFFLAAPILLGLLCLTLGLALALAVANVFYRDVEHFVGLLLLPWFFLTPVFYSLEQLPGAVDRPWLIELLRYANPVTPYVESMRATILQGDLPGPGHLAYVFLVGPAIALIGLWLVQRYDGQLAAEL